MNDIIVDVIRDTGNKIIVSQNDNLTKTYKLIVTKNNARYDLSNKKVRFAFLKNGTRLGDIVEELNISDATNGVVDFPITSTITRENGTFTCGLAIFNDSGYMENTAFFNMLVKESLFEKISGGLIDEGAYGQILSLLEKGEKLQKKLEPLVSRAEVVTPKLENLVPRAEAITQPLQNTVQDAENKKPQLDASIKSAKEFINGLDGSTNIPQIRIDLNKLQNGLKTNQELAYEGHNLKCENTLDGRIEDITLEGMTYQNLLNPQKDSFTIHSNGTSQSIATKIISLNVSLKPSTTYTIIYTLKQNIGDNSISVGGNNSYLDFLIEKTVGTHKKTFPTKAEGFTNDKIVFYIYNTASTDDLVEISEVYLLEGDYSNKYTPLYFEGIKSIGETEESKINICSNDKESKEVPKDKIEYKLPFEGGLKGLPSGVKDLIYNKDDGCYVMQKIGRVVLTSSENIGKWADSADACWFTIKNDLLFNFNYQTTNNNLLCNKFNAYSHGVFSSSTPIQDGLEGISANENYFTIRIKKNKLGSQDIAGFKKWLQSNPITVYYELAEPVEIKISDTKLSLDTYNALTYVFSNNAISPNIKLKVASNIGSIIQQNAKSINDIYKLIDEVIIPQLTTNSADIQVLKIK